MPDHDTATGTPLARWMERFRITNRELAKRIDVHENHIGLVRTGARKPNDELKVKLQRETQQVERELGSASPAGVRITDWFPVDVVEAASNGGR